MLGEPEQQLVRGSRPGANAAPEAGRDLGQHVDAGGCRRLESQSGAGAPAVDQRRGVLGRRAAAGRRSAAAATTVGDLVAVGDLAG